MSTVIGDVEFRVGLNGNTVPAQAKKIAKSIESAGSRGGDGFGRSFSAKLDNALKDADKKFDSWNPLRKLDNDVQLVIGAIIAAGDQIAVLGSAAGAGLLAVGGGIASLAVGGAASIGILVSLFQDIADAPAAMRPTIAQFKALGDAFGDVNEQMSLAAFDEIGDSFGDLNQVIRLLEPSLEGVSRVIGKAIRGFADFTQSVEGFGLLEKLIKNAEGNLDTFLGTVGTLGKALLRAFDGAQPLIEDMFQWFDRLANQFDRFTRSDSFTDWISNAQVVWNAFGGTLDAVALALHNLVTPESVQRTADLLDNLARLAPGLGAILNAVGTLDPIGLLVGILADLTDAFIVVEPAVTAVALALHTVIEAIPAPTWLAAAAAVGVFAAAFTALKVVATFGTTFELLGGALAKLTSNMGLSATASSRMSVAIGRLGVVGLAAAGFLTLTEVTKGWARELAGIDGIIKRAVKGNQSLLTTIDELSLNIPGLSQDFKDVEGALDGLSQWNGGNFLAGIGQGLKSGSTDAFALNRALGELDKGMKDLSLEEQVKKFSGWAEELGATDEQIAEMIDSMPEFKKRLEDAALAEDGTADSADILRIALEDTIPAAEGSLAAMLGLSGGMEDTAITTQLQADAMERLAGKSLKALDAVEGAAEGIKTMGSATRSNRGAALDYEAAIDDLNASIAENGATLAIQEEAGRTNVAALDSLAESALNLAGEQYNLTGSSEAAAAAIQTGRDQLIAQLATFGIVGDEANAYADSLGLIPADVETVISANTEAGMQMADAFATRLYELGLISVNPVLTLEAKDATAEASQFQTKLEAMDTSVTTTTLDADSAPAGTVLGDLLIRLESLENEKTVPKIDADNREASEKILGVTKSLDTLDKKTTEPEILVYNDEALTGTKEVTDALAGVKNKTVTITVNTNYVGGRPPQTAMGGMFFGSQLRQIAEAGPEAVVPLNRPLSQVDPAVRALSAFAQGLPLRGGSATGPGGGNGRTVNIQPGAIVVQGAMAPETTATLVVNRIAERVAG